MSTMQNTTPAMRATTDIGPFRMVNINVSQGLDNKVEEANANDVQIVGVTQGSNRSFDSAEHAASGDMVALQTGGIVLIEAGGTLDAGDRVKSDADGKAVVALTSTTTVQGIVGTCLQDAAADDIVQVLWGPYNFLPAAA